MRQKWSNMGILSLQIVLVLPLLVQGQSFFKSNCNATSEHAAELCTLATPYITYSTDGETVDVTGTPVSESLWVGYVKGYTALSYKGCVHKKDLRKFHKQRNIRADPGHCYSYCKTQFVGMRIKWFRKTICYCFDILPNVDLKWKRCTAACDSPTNTLCGDGDFVSIYRRVQYKSYNTSQLEENGNERHCLAYDSSGYYFWSTCGNSLRVLCKKDDDSLNQSMSVTSTWPGSIRRCLSNGLLPVDSDTNMATSEGGPFWVADIRSFSIFETPNRTTSDNLQQGYITSDGSEINLDFALHGDSIHALCAGDDKSRCTQTSPTIVKPTTSTTTAAKATTATTASTQSTLITGSSTNSLTVSSSSPASKSPETTASTSTVTTKDSGTDTITGYEKAEASSQQRQSKDGKKIVAVYVAIPFVLVVVAVVVVFFIWRKRQNACRKGKDTAEYHGTEQSKVNIRNAVANAAYEDDHVHKFQSRDDLQHDYVVLEPHNEYAAIKDADLQNIVDDEYDTANVKVNGVVNETSNVYNRLKDVAEDTYNHTIAFSSREDDTYNHTGEDQNEYNTTETLSPSKRRLPVTESEYSNTNNTGDPYNHTDRAIADNNASMEDTYNHTFHGMRYPNQEAYTYAYTKPIPKEVRPPLDKSTNDYAYAAADIPMESAKPFMVELDKLPNAGSYEFAKTPKQTGDYELAKLPGV